MAILGKETVSVTTFATGSTAAGDYVPGATTARLVRGSIQPVSERTRDRLPEGIRTRATLEMYTRATLFTERLGTDQKADQVTRKGRLYDVIGVEDWTGHKRGLPHFRYVLEEIGEDETP